MDDDQQMLAALQRLYLDPQPVALELSKLEAWILCSAVQLACRHPEFSSGQTKPIAEAAARLIMSAVAGDDAPLNELAERGWDKRFDVPVGPTADLAPTPSDRDIAHLEQILGGKETHLSAHIFRLIKKADAENRDRIRRVYPHHVAALERWEATARVG